LRDTQHTAQIFQVLDVTLFGVLKRRPRYELPFGDEKVTGQFKKEGLSPLQTNNGGT
jgi:hypothetical protein